MPFALCGMNDSISMWTIRNHRKFGLMSKLCILSGFPALIELLNYSLNRLHNKNSPVKLSLICHYSGIQQSFKIFVINRSRKSMWIHWKVEQNMFILLEKFRLWKVLPNVSIREGNFGIGNIGWFGIFGRYGSLTSKTGLRWIVTKFRQL